LERAQDKRKGRGLWAKTPFFLPRSRTREGGRAALAGGAPGSAAARKGENGGRNVGYSSLFSPWSGTTRGDGSSALGGGRQWWLGRWRSGAREAGRGSAVRCGVLREAAQGLYKRWKAVRGRYFELAELQWPAMVVREKSRRGLRPAGFTVDSAL
jgi:hypothetical protein